jgi:hypothetical protein
VVHLRHLGSPQVFLGLSQWSGVASLLGVMILGGFVPKEGRHSSLMDTTRNAERFFENHQASTNRFRYETNMRPFGCLWLNRLQRVDVRALKGGY